MGHPKESWGFSEAKAKLSRVVERAASAPQIITHRGREPVVVISLAEYRALVERAAAALPEQRWREFLKTSAAIRAAGGGVIETGARTPRRSPFES